MEKKSEVSYRSIYLSYQTESRSIQGPSRGDDEVARGECSKLVTDLFLAPMYRQDDPAHRSHWSRWSLEEDFDGLHLLVSSSKSAFLEFS